MENNCWEFMDCAAYKRESCPAYPSFGTTCWLVAGTMCKEGKPQGYFADKLKDCKVCPWYKNQSKLLSHANNESASSDSNIHPQDTNEKIYGAYLTQLGEYVRSEYGEEAWATALDRAGIASKIHLPSEDYPDSEMKALIDQVSKISGVARETILNHLGVFMAPTIARIYHSYFDKEWTVLDMLTDVPSIISRIQKNRPAMKHPQFNCMKVSDDELYMTYDSQRRMCSLAKGLIEGFAKYFGDEVKIEEETCMLKGASACKLKISLVKSHIPGQTLKAKV